LIAKKDTALKNMLPKGIPVCIKVHWINDYGNGLYESDCFTYTR
jgi:hypothetical protein